MPNAAYLLYTNKINTMLINIHHVYYNCAKGERNEQSIGKC
ncbi:hypothetical protein EMIT074MI3_11041 [Bacillus licheniformis]|nr:hypothetical protein B4164_2222 [Bacillus licheniformis]TWK92995.1 hypothetical protein CHCC20325_2979 [Bacillus licheniformis]TWM22177.1 hypothetical protein CHCC15087_0711 [Bacillus licheniformis]